ncbi:MAG: LysM peptidoglycan-binding domain-containing protein [Bacillota bacterium]
MKSRKVVLCFFLVVLLAAGAAEAAVNHTVQRGETVWRISQQYGTTVAAVAGANNLSESYLIHTGQNLIIPGKHRVSRGETLYRIAQQYGISVTQIAQASGISNPALIFPGQILTIPGGSGTALPPAQGDSLSNADMDLFARLVHSESAGEPYLGQVAVAASVLNRVKDSRYPGSVRAVILQVANGYYQYSPVLDGRINLPASETAYRAVQDALNGSDPSLGATGFYNPRKTSNLWVRSQPVTTVIGNHVFFR